MSSDATSRAYRGLPQGTPLNGIYAIDEMIGAGGMGEVYRGHELQTGARVAIKMLLPDMAENEAALALFRREASALLNLHHDAIVRYFLFTIEPTLQRPYLAMEFIEGRPLADMLEAGPLPYDQVVGLVRRVAAGLHIAHERGLVHRDVSPDNIIIPGGGVTRAKIIDFGIARSTSINDPTIIGDGFAGKHNYVSPEQVGLYGHNVTFKSDIYSFGLVIYYAIAGEKLSMGGSQFQLVEKRRKVPDLSAVDGRLRPLLERMLQPDPTDRPDSMAVIAEWPLPESAPLLSPLPGTPASQPRVQPTTHRNKPSRRTTLLMATVAIVAVSSAFGLYSILDLDPKKPARPATPVLTQNPSLAKNDGVPTAVPGSGAESPQKQAALPVPPSAEPALPLSRIDSIRNYIDLYEGGDCLLIVPVAISQSAAVLEGFSSSSETLESFAQAFRGKQGFNASVGARQITGPQCPAVKFVNALRGDRARAPRLSLDSVELKNGDTLAGTIENFGNRTVELLLVSDNGQVQSLTSLLKSGIDSTSFALRLQRNQPDAMPQLLVAIATSKPLNGLRGSQQVAADILFPQLLQDAKAANTSVSASARFFKLEN